MPRQPSKHQQETPVVLIHGFAGWGERRPLFGLMPNYFPLAEIHGKWQKGPVVAVDVSPVGSDHDRACETFAQLMGLRVDYGEIHSMQCEHDRFGVDYSVSGGLLMQWDAKHPLHLVGHSFGGNTALTLFQYLAEDFWGLGTSHEWVLSITTICSPMRGTNLVFAIGLQESMKMRKMSWLAGLVLAFGPVLWVQTRWPWTQRIIDFQIAHWKPLSEKLPVCASWNHPYWRTGDNMLTESTPRGCRERLCNGLKNLTNIHLIAVVGDHVEPLTPLMAALRSSIALSCIGIPMAHLLSRCQQSGKMLRAKLSRLIWRSLVLAAVGWSGLVTVLALIPRLRQYRPWLDSAIMKFFRPVLHACIVRPYFRLCSNELHTHTMSGSLPRRISCGLADHGKRTGDCDGIVNLLSQRGLDAPTIHSGTRRGAGTFLKTVRSVTHVHGRHRTPGMNRAYSGDVSSPHLDDQKAFVKGKWFVVDVPDADHSLGTCLSKQSYDMYSCVFELLSSVTP